MILPDYLRMHLYVDEISLKFHHCFSGFFFFFKVEAKKKVFIKINTHVGVKKACDEYSTQSL